MKVTAEFTEGFTINPKTGEAKQSLIVHATIQAKPHAKIEKANIIAETRDPAFALEAAAAYLRAKK